jgi:hypothetical protein
MAKVNHSLVETSVKVIDTAEVNRWKHIEAEGKMMAGDNHKNWHKIYQGTARD